MIREALLTYGTLEVPGTANNPVIIGWAKEVKGSVAEAYKADSIPWCGLWMAVIAKRSGWEPVNSPLWALSWASFGQYVGNAPSPKVAALGDVLVFTRNGGGHVGLYVGEDSDCYHVLGGNQSDSVCITRIAKSRLYTARRPKWKSAQPASVKKIVVGASGAISKNEA